MATDGNSCPSTIQVNLQAIRENVASIRKQVGSAKIMAVVKANAYGHGLIQCAQVLQSVGIDYLGVARVEEGMELRAAGITTPIHVFAGICVGQIGLYLDNDLDLTASSLLKLNEIAEIAESKKIKAKVHLKIDTGLNRIGMRMPGAIRLIEKALGSKWITIQGIFSHFACAENPDSAVTAQQMERFSEAGEYFEKRSVPMPLRHIANSAALMLYPQSHFDMVRPGLLIYGIPPTRALAGQMELKPALSFQSEIVFFKVVLAGAGVSYGHTWHAAQDTRVVTIPIGYADGLPRRLSNCGSVLIRGKRYPIVGTICMDQTMIAIGNDQAYLGDSVVIVGEQDGERIDILDIADAIGTVPHEILSCLPQRTPRVYLDL